MSAIDPKKIEDAVDALAHASLDLGACEHERGSACYAEHLEVAARCKHAITETLSALLADREEREALIAALKAERFDPFRNEVTLHGVRYSCDLFAHLGVASVGTWVRVEKRDGEVLTLRLAQAPDWPAEREEMQSELREAKRAKELIDAAPPLPASSLNGAVAFLLARWREREEMLALLREVEWEGRDMLGRPCCPVCGGLHPGPRSPEFTLKDDYPGHAPDCRLAAFLKAQP